MQARSQVRYWPYQPHGALCAFVSSIILVRAHWAVALDNGLMRTPAMGYNPWNAFHDQINETVVLQTIELMAQTGLVSAGYKYIVLDDGWPRSSRSDEGKLVADPQKFPSGIKALADKVHAKGMKLGIYSDAGTSTCAKYPASLGFEVADARSFADWGVDFLKYDNCYSADPTKVSVRSRYEAMRDALNRTGRPIAFSMCEWGVSAPWEYGRKVGNSWRTHADISLKIEADWRGVIDNLDATAGLSSFAGPGGWNDCDMLEVGPPGGVKLTLTEQQAHFALWALVKSPLFIGADVRLLESTHLEILKAAEVIALNQDSLGVAGDLVWKQGPKEVWAAPLSGGDRGVVLLNRHLNTDAYFQWANLSVAWNHIGIAPSCKAVVRDLFSRKDLGTFTQSFTAPVANHGVLALRIHPKKGNCRTDTWRPWSRGIMTHSFDAESPTAEEDDFTLVRQFGSESCPTVNVSARLYVIWVAGGLLVTALAVVLRRRSRI